MDRHVRKVGGCSSSFSTDNDQFHCQDAWTCRRHRPCSHPILYHHLFPPNQSERDVWIQDSQRGHESRTRQSGEPPIIPMSPSLRIFESAHVGQASRLTSSDLYRSQFAFRLLSGISELFKTSIPTKRPGGTCLSGPVWPAQTHRYGSDKQSPPRKAQAMTLPAVQKLSAIGISSCRLFFPPRNHQSMEVIQNRVEAGDQHQRDERGEG